MDEQQIKNMNEEELINLYKELIKEIDKLDKDLEKFKEGEKNAG